MNPKRVATEEFQELIFKEFCKLSLKNKLVIYAKLTHGNNFRAYNDDLFDQSRRSISKVYRAFIESVKNEGSSENQI